MKFKIKPEKEHQLEIKETVVETPKVELKEFAYGALDLDGTWYVFKVGYDATTGQAEVISKQKALDGSDARMLVSIGLGKEVFYN